MATRKSSKGNQPEGGGKREEVLSIASEYFLSHGFVGASINAMARESGISKESIYRYFKGKEDLFKAVIDNELSLYKSSLEQATSDPPHRDLGQALLDTAIGFVTSLTSDRTLALRRLIFHETRRAPEVGRHYYGIGPVPAYSRLEALFEAHRGSTDVPPAALARYFIAMLMQPLFLERECGIRKQPRPAETRKYAQRVVDDFLKAFYRK